MSGWTPGPWRALHPRETLQAGFKIACEGKKQHGGGNAICTVRPANRSWEAEDEAEANARLIAASPTMAEYIKKQADKGDADAAEILAIISG